MQVKESKNTWNTAVELLRLFTPILLALLSYLFLGFQTILQDNTKAITSLQIQLAQITEQLHNLEKTDSKFEDRIIKLEDSTEESKRRISILEARIGK